MKQTDLNEVINRHNTGSIEWDFMQRCVQHNETDLLPLWISGYDFAWPPEVLQGPDYTAYDSIITLNGRTRIDNPLIASPQGYQFDFDPPFTRRNLHVGATFGRELARPTRCGHLGQ